MGSYSKEQSINKGKSLKQLIKELDKVFSAYIRMRDTKDYGGVRYGNCITCGQPKPYKLLDCGHFITRDLKPVRWEEKNCNAQCQECNRFKSGKQFEHGIAIDRKFGKGTAESLLMKSRNTWKMSPFELEFLIKEYKEKTRLIV